MRVYWDSTALLNALAAQSVLARLDEGDHVTRSHADVMLTRDGALSGLCAAEGLKAQWP